MSNSCTLGVNAVGVNPETQRHVRVSKQVNNSATRYVAISVCIAITEAHINSAINCVNSHEINSVRSANRNKDVEHNKLNEVDKV